MNASVIAPSVTLPFSEAVKAKFVQDLAGWVELRDDFFETLEALLALPKWTVAEEQLLEKMVHAGLGYALAQLFGDSCKHWNAVKKAFPADAIDKPPIRYEQGLERMYRDTIAMQVQRAKLALARQRHAQEAAVRHVEQPEK